MKEITKPVPFINNVVGSVESVMERTAFALINFTEATVNAPIKMTTVIINGENVCVTVGQAIATPITSIVVETIAVSQTVVEESKSIGTGIPSQRVRSNKYEWGFRILIYDALETEHDFWVGTAWRSAYLIYSSNRFTHIIAATSWKSVFNELTKIANKGKISEIQYCGHGAIGAAVINHSDYFSEDFFQTTEFQSFVNTQPFKQNGTGLIWFRTCETLNGERGRRFAERLSAYFGIRIAGHTIVISKPKIMEQGGFQLLLPNERATWKDGSGFMIETLDSSPQILEPIFIP